MASYVIPIGSDEDAFLEETQNLVLKMLGLVPSEFDEGEFDEGGSDYIVHSCMQSFTPQSVDVEVEVSRIQITQSGQDDNVHMSSVDTDLEVDHAPAMSSKNFSYSAASSSIRISRETSEDELRFEAAAKKLDKMAEMFSAKYKDEFKKIEEAFCQNGSYSSFSSFMGKIIPAANPMWYKISMLFGISRYLVKKDKKNSKHFSGITSFTVDYIKENFADYIIANGGWDSVASVSLKEIEGELFCEKAALEGFIPQDAKNETVTDGKPPSDPDKGSQTEDAKNETVTDGKPPSDPDKGSQTEDAKQDEGAGDSKVATESSFFDFNPFIVTATAAAVAVAYAVMKT